MITRTSVAEPAFLDRTPVATTGSAGSLRLVVAPIAGRTRVVDLECTGPVQVLRCQHLDDHAPDIASIIIASPSGGVLQGDRLRIDVEVRAGARLVLETQSATRLYRMPDRPARIDAWFTVAEAGWLEYVPDPYIPFAGSDTTIETSLVVEPTAAVLIGEVVAAGRVARGEVFGMTRFASTLTAARAGGELLFTDATVLEPGDPLGDPGMMGSYRAIGRMYLIAEYADATTLRAAIPPDGSHPAVAGASTLPNGAGSWLRVLAADSGEARAAIVAGSDAARVLVLGTPGPPSRRSGPSAAQHQSPATAPGPSAEETGGPGAGQRLITATTSSGAVGRRVQPAWRPIDGPSTWFLTQ
jgi:urease accessory protein